MQRTDSSHSLDFHNIICFSPSNCVLRPVLQVLVLYFAKSVELAGVKEEQIVVQTPISSADLWRLLLQQHPRYCDVFTVCTVICSWSAL